MKIVVHCILILKQLIENCILIWKHFIWNCAKGPIVNKPDLYSIGSDIG